MRVVALAGLVVVTGFVVWRSWPAAAGPGAPDAWTFTLPAGFPAPRVPADNPMSDAKVALGRRLFYDKRLSENGTQSCASCHEQARAFTDGKAHAVGSTGQQHRRSAMSLANVGYASHLTWASPLLTSLEAQAMGPMFGDTPVELGLRDAETFVARLAQDPSLVAAFAQAFPEQPTVGLDQVLKALAAFERTLISGDSPYDRYLAGDTDALSPAAQRGLELFFSERTECFHCHGGFNFTDAFGHVGAEPERAFHNNGLYDVDGHGAYPKSDTGLYEHTRKPGDMGRFKAPTLRNIAVTAPYMHDGSLATLDDVLRHYEAGGRRLEGGPDAGDGAQSPLKDRFVQGFILTDNERADVVQFLEALTDTRFLTDPRFGEPQ